VRCRPGSSGSASRDGRSREGPSREGPSLAARILEGPSLAARSLEGPSLAARSLGGRSLAGLSRATSRRVRLRTGALATPVCLPGCPAAGRAASGT
jgi:hypothetical protein